MPAPSMRSLVSSLLRRYRDWLGPAFVAFEAVMHVYLAIYLTINWTNLAIWAFTVFELTMFIYLFITGRDKKHKPTLGERHMRHYQFCGCLGDKAVCCDPNCDCEE